MKKEFLKMSEEEKDQVLFSCPCCGRKEANPLRKGLSRVCRFCGARWNEYNTVARFIDIKTKHKMREDFSVVGVDLIKWPFQILPFEDFIADTTGVVVEDIKALKVVDNALVPVYESKGRRIISAREMHTFLESKREFVTWIKDRIEKYGFTAGEDFLTNLSKNTRGRPSTEYFLTMDTAKEIAMVENNEKGRMIRRHFIEIEKKYRAGVALESPKEPEKIEKPKPEARLALPEPEAPEVLPHAISSKYPDKRYWTPEEAAAELGLAGYIVLYNRLVELGLATRTKKGIIANKERRQFIRQWTFKSKGGNNTHRPVITPWGMDYLESVL